MQITLTTIQAEIIKGISELTEKRAQEPNNNKKININAFSLSKQINRDYKAVKRNLIKLKEKICH